MSNSAKNQGGTSAQGAVQRSAYDEFMSIASDPNVSKEVLAQKAQEYFPMAFAQIGLMSQKINSLEAELKKRDAEIERLKQTPVANRKGKDSMFQLTFSDPYFVAQMASVLLGRLVLEKDVRIVTLRSILLNGPVNDLAAIVEEKELLLVEAETLFTKNILFREGDYLFEIYRNLLQEDYRKLYQAQLVQFPAARLWVVNSGLKDVNISKICWEDVLLPNIRPLVSGDPEPLRLYANVYAPGESYNILDQFVDFSRMWTRNARKSHWGAETIDWTLKECRERKTMAEVFEKYGMEVNRVLRTMLTQEKIDADLHETISELTTENGEQAAMIRMLFRMNREQALQALVEEFHYTPEQVKAFEAKYV